MELVVVYRAVRCPRWGDIMEAQALCDDCSQVDEGMSVAKVRQAIWAHDSVEFRMSLS